jgi:prepilin-type N-terminal cleavage/methylation domain-containing protein
MRRGFTLLELLVALVLTSVVALLVYGSAQAGVEAQRRLQENELSLQRARTLRAILQDALRNVRPATRAGESTLVVVRGVDQRGRPRDRLRFVTAGGLPPLSGSDWEVTLQPTPQGLKLLAAALGVRAPARVLGPIPGVTGLRVRLVRADSDTVAVPVVTATAAGDMEGGAGPQLAALPRAVEITYWSDSSAVGSPLRMAIPMGEAAPLGLAAPMREAPTGEAP